MLYAEVSDLVTVLDQHFCRLAMGVSGSLVMLCFVTQCDLSQNGLPGLVNSGWLSMDAFALPFIGFRDRMRQRLEAEYVWN